MASLETEIASLRGLTQRDLRMAWRRLHRSEPPARLSRDLLVRAIAHRMQEQAHGGLTPATKHRLRALTRGIDTKGSDIALGPLAKPGTRLLREWGGHTHTVTILEDGFDYEGGRYRSLTQIATLITGAHWSGPRFFGVRKRGRGDLG